MNNRAQRRRFASKLRAKYIFKTNLPACMGAALLVYGLSLAGSALASLVLPAEVVLLNEPDPALLIPTLEYFGLTVLVDIVLSPLQSGYFWWLSEKSMLRERRLKEALVWLTDIRKLLGAMGARVMYYLVALRDAVIFLGIPAAAILLAEKYLSAVPEIMVSVTSIGMFVLLAGAVISLIDVLSYRPALVLYAASPERGIKTVFRECREFMNHRKGEFLVLHLSMILYFLAEVFTSGAVMFYTRPFYDLTVLSYTQYAYKLWLVDTGKLPREQFEFPLPGLPEFDSGWLW